jgi:hypothetical protein
MSIEPLPVKLPEEHTAMKLSRALEAANLPELAKRASTGEFHDYLSPHPFPEMLLLDELKIAANKGSLPALALIQRHMNGEFDASYAESQQWADSPDGQAAFAKLLRNEQ